MNDQTPNFEGQNPAPKPSVDGLGIASLVLGVISLCCCCFVEVSALFGGVAIALACISRAKLGRFSGSAVAGLVCGIFGALIGIVALVINAVLFLNPELASSLESLFSVGLETPTPTK